MWDIGMVLSGIAFFALALSYVRGCERLGVKEQVK